MAKAAWMAMPLVFLLSAKMPAGVPVSEGLILQLETTGAVVEEGRIVFMEDHSGRGNHATGGIPPLYLPRATPSGRGIMRFDGAGQYLQIAASPDFDGRAKTTFVVFRANSLGIGRMINSAYATLDPANPAASPHYSVGNAFANSSGGGVFRIQNRSQSGSSVAVSTPNESVSQGAFYIGVNLWKENGDISAIIVDAEGRRLESRSSGADAVPEGHLWTRLGANAAVGSPSPRDYFEGDLAAVLMFNRALGESELGLVLDYLHPTYLRFTPPMYYGEWIAAFGLPENQTGPLANPAFDGIPNLTKFAFGLDPTKPFDGMLPLVSVLDMNGYRHIAVSREKNPMALGVGQAVEVSSDLVHWSSDPDEVEIIIDDDRLLMARDKTPISLEGRRFIRLRNYLFTTGALSAGEETWTNSLDMKMIRVPPGQFRRGGDSAAIPGSYHERPSHDVIVSRGFSMSSKPVTNAQYEKFQPGHSQRRGEMGLSSEDDEAVLFVSWHDAVAFTEWLSQKEGKVYRLPTEAEWEYAARAGTRTPYFTGDALPQEYHRNQHDRQWQAVPLQVGRTPPNPWGFHDMHGLVEEWCLDWYGPYVGGKQVDPVGYRDGVFKVTRGGSHNTHVRYLRSAARMGEVPENANHVIGFRVVQGDMPKSSPREPPPPPHWADGVLQVAHDWSDGPDPSVPFFSGPIPFVNIPIYATGPVYSHHNHSPAITGLPNGDLLAVWYSTHGEWSRETKKVAARLRLGAEEWDEASVFFDPPARNAHASALWWDGEETVYAFFGHSVVAEGHFTPTMMVSKDNGRTWSRARVMRPRPTPLEQYTGILPLQRTRPAWQAFGLNDGGLAVVTKFPDNIAHSHDGGEEWVFASRGKPGPGSGQIHEGGTGFHIPSIHPVMVELNDGRLLAFTSRVNQINGRMIQSISSDRGETWTYGASPFPALGPGNGQRVVLIRLMEGPLFLASFTDHTWRVPEEEWQGMMFPDSDGKHFRGYGLFGALSFDEGENWDVRKLITPGAGTFDGGAWTREFTASPTQAEPRGYLNATQTPDGIIHLISSRLHYRFNLAWLLEPNEGPDDGP